MCARKIVFILVSGASVVCVMCDRFLVILCLRDVLKCSSAKVFLSPSNSSRISQVESAVV